MRYNLTKNDFDTAFDFALRYHLDPKKSQSSRTSGATRGLGGVLDSFMLGKLVELGVSKVLKNFNLKKDYELDFDIKQNNEVINEPDIVRVTENNKKRLPKCFLEIKNISKSDRWVGLTLEQFETIKKSEKLENIFIIGAYIENSSQGNIKQKDLLGIYFKDKFKSPIFKNFTDMNKIEVVIEYVLSGLELQKFGNIFKKGFFTYETEIFEKVGKSTESSILKGKFKKLGNSSNDNLDHYVINKKYPDPAYIGDIFFKGEIELYEKINPKSLKRYVRCISDVVVTNKTLGEFKLLKNQIYFFNLGTVGRNPALNRNNIWIAKRSISYLCDNKMILSAEKNLKRIAEII